MISDFNISPILLLRQPNFDIVGLSPERGFIPESCLAICHPRLVTYKPVAYKKRCIADTGIFL